MDACNTSVVTKAPFELPQISQPTIEYVVNVVSDPEIIMSMQDVLDTLEGLCTHRVENPEKIEANVRHLCEADPHTRELLPGTF